MAVNSIDTNVLLRFLVETPDSIPDTFRGVFSFFRKLEQEELAAHVSDLSESIPSTLASRSMA